MVPCLTPKTPATLSEVKNRRNEKTIKSRFYKDSITISPQWFNFTEEKKDKTCYLEYKTTNSSRYLASPTNGLGHTITVENNK